MRVLSQAPAENRLPIEPARAPTAALHLWQARLDLDRWPPAAGLPPAERDRAAALLRPEARGRWVAARWALRGVLGRYLEQEPAAIELCFGERGKPMLTPPYAALRFNLSHSAGLALIAVASGREVGVDVERIGAKPAAYYAAWARREAIAKCHGVGLWAPLPDAPVAASGFDPGPGFAGAVAIAGDEVPPLQRFDAEPG
jgi:phosphopantetheinyl transferase